MNRQKQFLKKMKQSGIPEALLFEKHAASSGLHQTDPELFRKLRTILLAVGVFVVSAGVTAAVIWVWLNG